MKATINTSVLVLSFTLFGCATNEQVQSMEEQLLMGEPCPVGFEPSTTYNVTLYTTDTENKEDDAKVTTKCVPEDLNKEREMEWR